MSRFDFIGDERFRAGLDSDYAEIVAAIESKSWKSAQVLCGSVVEAVLADFLLVSGYQKKTGKDPLKCELADLITVCQGEGILSTNTAQLSTVLRHYRNLIHPGRVIRLGDAPTEESATIARAVLEMVLKDVAAKRREKYGYTAEQILAKIERDPAAHSILPHLLKELSDFERERLLLQLITSRYMECKNSNLPADWNPDVLKKSYRTIFETASDETKTRAMDSYVKTLKEADGATLTAFEDAFVVGDDIEWVQKQHVGMVLDRWISRLTSSVADAELRLIGGSEDYLELKQVVRFLDPLVRASTLGTSDRTKKQAKLAIEGAWFRIALEKKKINDRFLKRLDEWKTSFEKVNNQAAVVIITELKAACSYPPDAGAGSDAGATS